jgi:outer membrane protein TolC
MILTAALLVAAAAPSAAQAPAIPPQPAQSSPVPPLQLVQPEGANGAPAVITLQDALQRARDLDAQYQTASADAALAREDTVQARAGLLPAFSFSTQYLGNQANGVNPNGRFVSLDGVNMYRVWAVARQELSAPVLTRTPLHRAQFAEAAAAARLEIASRGLVVTVTRAYYALVTAQRKYATAQESAQTAARFRDIARQQQRLGQVAMSDVVKAEIQSQQQSQGFRDAALAMDTARLELAVLVFPTLTENFTVIDDLSSAPALPPFADVGALAARNNADVRAAEQALAAARQDVQAAKYAFMPTLAIDAVYGIEANELALHSPIAAQPELGVLPNLGYFVTLNLTVPVWDWGGLRSKLHQSETRQKSAQLTLTQTQRQTLADLYAKFNEAQGARAAVDSAQQVADLAAESLRLTNLRYSAGEATALEVVDAQNTLVQARNGFDDAGARYRVALAELQTLTGRF